MSSKEILVDIKNLSKRYEIYKTPRDRLKQLVLPRLFRMVNQTTSALRLSKLNAPPHYFREFWALTNVSLQVRAGETLGIIGRNGSGKSTLLQLLAGTLTPTNGSVTVNGRIAALLELGSGFNPEFTGRENVFLNGQILGLTQKQIAERYDQIVAFADIGQFIDQPVKTYSSGMFVRLAFAVQAHIDASIVIIDEALAVGDVFFTQKCFARLRELVSGGAAVILVTHDMATVTQFCTRVLVLNNGEEMFSGEPVPAIRRYMALQRDAAPGITARARIAEKLKLNGDQKSTSLHFDWPSDDAFFETDKVDIVGTGQAEFTGVALCDETGEAARVFQMGDTADFFVEYRLLKDIDVPILGVTIANEKGLLVHGKNSIQYKLNAPDTAQAGQTLRYRQRIVLDLAPGEYSFVVGLATTDADTYRHSEHMSHGDLSNSMHRVLSVGNAGTFTVGLRRDGIALTHHGLANLPGACDLFVTSVEKEGKNDRTPD
jgi:lipopolysaccharide transport system ATP-binding protein